MDIEENQPDISVYKILKREGIDPWEVTPTQKVFDEMVFCAIKIWESNYSDKHGYVTEKVSKIQSLTNVKNNVMTCYQMFDGHNKRKFLELLSPEAIAYVQFNS